MQLRRVVIGEAGRFPELRQGAVRLWAGTRHRRPCRRVHALGRSRPASNGQAPRSRRRISIGWSWASRSTRPCCWATRRSRGGGAPASRRGGRARTRGLRLTRANEKSRGVRNECAHQSGERYVPVVAVPGARVRSAFAVLVSVRSAAARLMLLQLRPVLLLTFACLAKWRFGPALIPTPFATVLAAAVCGAEGRFSSRCAAVVHVWNKSGRSLDDSNT